MMANMFPSPSAGPEGVRVFRAPRLWESNVRGALVAGMAGAPLVLVMAGMLIWQNRSVGWLVVLMILAAVTTPLILLPGNYAITWPYAVEVVEGKGLWFYAPFKKMYVPLEEVKEVKWSYAGPGWVIRLRKRRGVIRTLLIHVAWGRRGKELARAIEEELARTGPPPPGQR